MEPALALAREIVEVADRQDDAIYRLVGYRLLGTMQVFMGQHREALESLQQAERYRDPDRQKLLSYRFGFDPGLAVLCYKIWALTVPRPPQPGGANPASKCGPNFRSHGHAHTVAFCTSSLWFGPNSCSAILKRVNAIAPNLSPIAPKKRWSITACRAPSTMLAPARRANRRRKISRRCAPRSMPSTGPARVSRDSSLHISACRSLADGGRCDAQPRRRCEKASPLSSNPASGSGLPTCIAFDGQIALNGREPDRARAEACFLQAIEIAREPRGAHARTARRDRPRPALARAGSPDDPRALLEPILAAIEGGENTRDVRNARMLLAEIG